MRLADEIGRAVGTTPRLRIGGLLALDVIVDGKVVFSRAAEGGFVSVGEIVDRIKAVQS